MFPQERDMQQKQRQSEKARARCGRVGLGNTAVVYARSHYEVVIQVLSVLATTCFRFPVRLLS
jgi:hypothetical protein